MAQTPWEMAAVGKEFSHQSALFAWAAMAKNFGVAIANRPESYKVAGFAKRHFDLAQASPVSYPEPPSMFEPLWQLEWLHAIKNQGHGDRVRGSRSKAEGVREGVFDTFLPSVAYFEDKPPFDGSLVASCYMFCGLYIELKTPDRINHKNGGASDPQLKFQAFARGEGYAAELAHGWEAARDLLLTYLGKSPA